jgi:hypothetical protein
MKTMNAKRIGTMVLCLVLALGVCAVPVVAATAGDLRSKRLAVEAAGAEIRGLMLEARESMGTVRSALEGHVKAMEKVAPEAMAALKVRLDDLRQRMGGVLAEREFFLAKMGEFRTAMDAKDLEAAAAVLDEVAARQTTWKAAVETFIADAKALAADVVSLAVETGPIWEAQKAERDAFLAEVKEKKTVLDETHAVVQAKNEALKGILAEIRTKIEAGALDALSEDDRAAVKSSLDAVRNGVKTTFDGSVKAQIDAFHAARLAGDFEAALAALDRAIEIQAPRPAVLDGFLSQAQAALAALEAAATTLAPTGTL